jgi:hypothetical protein
MGGAACAKLLLNSGGVAGTLNGISNVLVSGAADSIPHDLIEEGEQLICEEFHKKLQAYEQKLLTAIGYKES